MIALNEFKYGFCTLLDLLIPEEMSILTKINNLIYQRIQEKIRAHFRNNLYKFVWSKINCPLTPNLKIFDATNTHTQNIMDE